MKNLLLQDINKSIDWLNWSAVLTCCFLIIISRVSNYNYITDLFKRRNNYNLNQTNFKKLASLTLIFNYYIVCSLFIWQFCIIKELHFFSKNILFIIIFMSILVIHNLKLLAIKIVDNLFNRRNHFHIRLHLYYFQVMGLIALPIYVLSYFLAPSENQGYFLNHVFTKINIYFLTACIFSIILIIREFKSLFTALSNRISLFYIILYLCTLEILPLILIIKILNGQVETLH